MNDHLRFDLETQGRALDVPPGDLDRVVRQGRRRSRRHRQATASLAVLAVLAGTVGAVELADAGRDGSSVSADGGGTVGATIGDAGIAWTNQRAATPLGSLSPAEVIDAGDRLFALSTGPGVRASDESPRRVVWQSTDGVDWTPGSTPESFYLSDLASADGRLYAIGTGPATAATAGGKGVPDVRVGWSDAGSTNWDDATLPIDLRTIAAGSTGVHVSGQDVAVGPQGVVAVATVMADLDVPAFLPDGVTAPNGWSITDDGVAVLGDGEDCPPGTTLFSEQKDRADSRGGPDATTSTTMVGASTATTVAPEAPPPVGQLDWSPCTDGDEDEMAPVPATEVQGVVATYTWAELDVEGDLLQAVRREPFLFHSEGVEQPFTRVEATTGSILGWTPLVQAGDDGFDLVVGRQERTGGTEVVALHSDDGRTWRPSATLGGAMSWVSAAGRVDGRLTLVGNTGDGDAVYAELDGGRWRTTSLTDLLGEERGEFWISAAGIGPLGVVVAVGSPGQGDDLAWTLVASRDGRTWSQESADELAGTPLQAINSVTVRGDRAVVSASLPRTDLSKPGQQLALLGTPR